MSSTFVELGPTAKVAINGIAYSVVEGSFELVMDLPEVTDTETGAGKRNKQGNYQFSATITAQRSTDMPPHASPYLLSIKTSIRLQIYPNGTGSDPYDITTFMIERWSGSLRVSGSEPQTFSFSGKSQGTGITLPSNA